MNSEQRRAKIEKKRQRKKIVRRIVFTVFLAALVCFFMKYFGLFNVKSIEVKGNVEVPKEEIIKRSSLSVGEDYFSISNKNRVRDVESIPMIKSCEISMGINGNVHVEIVEREPIFQIENYNEYYYLDDEVRIVAIKTEPLQNSKEIEEVEIENYDLGEFLFKADDERYKFIRELISNENIFPKISKVILGNDSLTMYDEDDVEIIMGGYNDVDYKLKMLSQIYQDIEETDKKVVSIDMVKGEYPVVELESVFERKAKDDDEEINPSNEVDEDSDLEEEN